MKRSISSVLVAGAAVFAAHAETTVVPMDDASWGYVVKGLGEAGHERAYVFTNTTAAMSLSVHAVARVIGFCPGR